MDNPNVQREPDGRWSFTDQNGQKLYFSSESEARTAASGGSTQQQPGQQQQPGVTGTGNVDQGKTGGRR